MYINMDEKEFTQILSREDLETIPDPVDVVKATSDNEEKLKKLQDELKKIGFRKVNFT